LFSTLVDAKKIKLDGRKKFFFEKKNQKTFAPLRAVLKHPGTKTIKVFLLLFVHKKKFCLLLPSAHDL
jgi:hypothetical protein